jgi:transcriptional regulator with XRE-family HTH domain
LSEGIVALVGRRIRALRMGRQGNRITQEQLAERAEISVSFLSMIERGERSPHLETLEKIAAALEVPVDELFRSENAPVDRVDSSMRPLAEYVRKRGLNRRDVEKLLAVARAMFGG